MRKVVAILPLLATLSACIGAPDAPRRQPIRQSTATFTPRPEARQCLANLGQRSASFTPIPDQFYGAGCSTLGTVRLANLQGDDAALALSNLGPVTCPLASSFAGWARFGIDRAARQFLGSALVRIETMGSYSCRNVAGSSRRSAHATANAIDVAAFILADGRRVSVQDDWASGTAQERRFLAVIHSSACKRFGTVLGPGYNAAHRDHLHLELSANSYCK